MGIVFQQKKWEVSLLYSFQILSCHVHLLWLQLSLLTNIFLTHSAPPPQKKPLHR